MNIIFDKIKRTNNSNYNYYMKISTGYGKQDYGLYYNQIDDPLTLKGQLTELHPYDNAEYCWAEIKDCKAILMRNYSRMYTITKEYDEDFYTNKSTANIQWLKEFLEEIITLLLKYNSNVKPKLSPAGKQYYNITESVSSNDSILTFNKIYPDYEIKQINGDIVLYHNTQYKNIKSIMNEGLLVDAGQRQGRGLDGDFVWATTEVGKGYGGCTVAFKVHKDKVKPFKVNDTEYTLPFNIPVKDILFIDIPFFQDYRLSEIPELINSYGQDKTLKPLIKYPNLFVNDFDVNEIQTIINEL